MKRTLMLILAFLIVAAGAWTGVVAYAEETSGGFTYTVLTDGTASITGCSETGDVVIPSTIDGYTVTNLARELFYGIDGITSVSIPACQ